MNRLTQHLDSVNETYFEHLINASSFAVKMIIGGMAGLVHAVFPFLCVKTGSRLIDCLHHDMVTHRQKNAEASFN